MGFIDDVKWVLEQSPPERQIALFSATMPREVKRVADQHLQNPVHIKIASKTATAENISQRYWVVRGTNKLDAITRILESEDTDGVIVFVRTKNATVELSDRLSARGFRCDALNGDILQANREKIIDRLRASKLDILIATDVVARGLDVERISHVINYDVPHDTESYIHRIGRTGRAGRAGKAVLFIAPREKRMLHSIERATKQPITPMDLPTVADINRSRVERFKQKVVSTVANEDLDFFSQLIVEIQQQHELSSEQIAAAGVFLAQGDASLILDEKAVQRDERSRRGPASGFGDDGGFRGHHSERGERREKRAVPRLQATPLTTFPDIEMRRFRLNVGRRDQVKPGNIVGAIANEAELESKYIGEIEIREDYSTVDLPADMPKEIMGILKKARVAGRALGLSVYKGAEPGGSKSSSANSSEPRKKSYNSKKRDRGEVKKKPRSDYAVSKRKARKKTKAKRVK